MRHALYVRLATVFLLASGGWITPLFAGIQSGNPEPILPTISENLLRNGTRIVHLPHTRAPSDGLVDIVFGYLPADGGGAGFRAATPEFMATYLAFSAQGRSVALAVHLAGGTFEVLDASESLGMGMRLRVPEAALADVSRQIVRFFSHAVLNFEVFEYARSRLEDARRARVPSPMDEVDLEVRGAMFQTPVVRDEGASAPLATTLAELQAYFDTYVGTDRAYVVASEPLPSAAAGLFRNIVERRSRYRPETNAGEATETILRFPSRPEGGVVLATAIPSPRYESWFGAVAIDRVLRRIGDPDTTFDFEFATGTAIHRIETPVRLPDYSEDVRDRWLARIQDLIFNALDVTELDAVRGEVLNLLDDRRVQEWFAAYDLWDSLELGFDAIRQATPDRLRTWALGFAGARRVVAIWSPAFDEPAVVVEDLAAPPQVSDPGPPPEVRVLGDRLRLPPIGGGILPELEPIRLERLDSGVTLADSDVHRVFVAGRFDGSLSGGTLINSGPGGTLWAFDDEPDPVLSEELRGVRADRLLIFCPSSGIERVRRRFESWSGGASDTSPSTSIGDVATADLPGLLIMKAWLDARLIQTGWWDQVDVRIEGVEGSRLLIDADPEREAQVRAWISELQAGGIDEQDFEQYRPAALRDFQEARHELQIILWQRSPGGTIPSPASFNLTRLPELARTYF